jgi:hypothetical protein
MFTEMLEARKHQKQVKRASISQDPQSVRQGEINRRNYALSRAKAGAFVIGAVTVLGVWADKGIFGTVTEADKGLEFVAEGNGSESEGLITGVATGAKNAVTSKIGDVRVIQVESAPAVSESVATLPACPTVLTHPAIDLGGRYVSTATYDVNAVALERLGGGRDAELAVDPLWENYFSADNNGMDPNNPTAQSVVLRMLVSIENCEIR